VGKGQQILYYPKLKELADGNQNSDEIGIYYDGTIFCNHGLDRNLQLLSN